MQTALGYQDPLVIVIGQLIYMALYGGYVLSALFRDFKYSDHTSRRFQISNGNNNFESATWMSKS